jgi:hypothetical protein
MNDAQKRYTGITKAITPKALTKKVPGPLIKKGNSKRAAAIEIPRKIAPNPRTRVPAMAAKRNFEYFWFDEKMFRFTLIYYSPKIIKIL